MILERRQTHYFAAIAMAVVLPIVFILGLVLRPGYVQTDTGADDLFARVGYTSAEVETLASERIKLGRYTFEAEAVRLSPTATAIALTSVFNLKVADPLLYWMPGDTAPEAIGDDAVLLGRLSGRTRRQFALPEEAASGQLVLFSQVKSTVMGAAPIPDSLIP